MSKRAILRSIGVLLVLAAAGMMAGTARAEEWSKKYSVSGMPELRVESNDAAIEVDSWERNEIEVRVSTRGW